MHGLGNDFVVIDNMNGKISLSKEQIVFLCDRHKGIGADGVILVEPSTDADCFMNYMNADGSQAQMCGNGVRCVTKFLKEEILPKTVTKTNFKIDTRSGIKEIEYKDDDTYSVNMGKPVFSRSGSSLDFPKDSITLEGLELNFVSMGNPFAIAFVENLGKYDFTAIGPKIENNKIFPNRMNFELVEQKNKNEFKVRVWERGCGETLACGTGACAVYALARKYEGAEKETNIDLPGGTLFMSENGLGDIIMRGSAVSVFSSMIEV